MPSSNRVTSFWKKKNGISPVARKTGYSMADADGPRMRLIQAIIMPTWASGSNSVHIAPTHWPPTRAIISRRTTAKITER